MARRTTRVFLALVGGLLALTAALFFRSSAGRDPPAGGLVAGGAEEVRARRVAPVRLRGGAGGVAEGGERAEADRGVIEGIVVEPDGGGVAGASVALFRGRGPAGARSEAAPMVAFALCDEQLPLRWAVQGDPGWELPAPMAVALSDAQGRFRFGGLGAGAYAVTATATAGGRGLAPVRAEVTPLAAGETRWVRLALGRGGLVLSGRVREAGGGPVVGARVTAALTERDGDLAVPAPAFGTSSGADGLFSLALLPGRYVLRAEAGGYATTSELAIVGANIQRDLQLEPAGSLAGRVVGRPGGEPVPAASVQARSIEGWSLGRSRAVESDGEGRFRLDGLTPGDFVVEARAAGRAGRSAPVRVTPGPSAPELVVELADGLALDGRVVDAAGRPVAGAQLTAWSRDGGPPAEATSAAGGRFRIEGLLPGRYELRAMGPQATRTRAAMKLVNRDLTGLELRLEGQVIVMGQVIDPSGGTVAGARVMAGTEPATLGWAGRSAPATITAADGRFRFQGLDAGRVTLRVEKEEVGSAVWVEHRIPAGAVRELTLRLQAGATLTGLVRFEDGSPAPGAVVYVEYPSQRRRFFDGHGREHVASRAVTGPDAAYTLAGLDPGDVRVSASPAGGALHLRQIPTFILGPAERKTLDLVVPREAGPSSLLPDPARRLPSTD